MTHFHHSSRGQKQEYKLELLVETACFLFPSIGKPPLLQPVCSAQVRAMLETLKFNFHNLDRTLHFTVFWYCFDLGFFVSLYKYTVNFENSQVYVVQHSAVFSSQVAACPS